ncbi:MAG: hypothetical protein FWF18_04285 [Dehalococcoidia bacterium]|nr:hypothetical protein [Dehalococcoidia bacterium]
MSAEKKKRMSAETLVFLVAFGLVFLNPFSLMYIGMYIDTAFSPNPPMPEIRYGEFPFRLEYEINGELIVIEDTVICEFDGVDVSWEGDGKTRKWKSHLASGNDRVVLLDLDISEAICALMGWAEYYMGDSNYKPDEGGLIPDVYIYDASQTVTYRDISIDDLYYIYGIRLISWEFTDPIVNTFK